MHTLLLTEAGDATALNEVITDFIKRKKNLAQHMSPHYQDLWREIERLIGSGGKRLRPGVCILAYKALGGQDVTTILPAAASLELLHLGMLIHDDIIDRDYVRYGVDNIAGSYLKQYRELVDDNSDRLHYAQSAALLAGDLMLSESYSLMAESHVDADTILSIQKLLGTAIFEVIGGELLDTEAAFRTLDAVSATEIALHKTASYSFTLPMLVGAQLARLPDHLLTHVNDFGTNLGIAFQLRDDIIGIFGDKSVTGKSTIGDIREGKRTYMVEQFYKLATHQQSEFFSKYFGNSLVNEEEANVIRKLLTTSGAYSQTETEITEYESKARSALKHLSVESNYVNELEQLIAVATKRTA